MPRRSPSLRRERVPVPRWIHAEVRGPDAVVAGGAGRFEIHLAVLAPLWAGTALRITWPLGWAPPSTDGGPGKVAWRVHGHGLILAEVVRRRTLQLNLTGGSLQAGDAVVVTYGEGEGATVQPWLTDVPARFDVKLDRAASGRFTPDAAATVRLVPGPPAHLHVAGPSTLPCGKSGPFRVVVLDRFGNLCPAVSGEALVRRGDGDAQEAVRVAVAGGRAEAALSFERPGIKRVTVTIPGLGLTGRSNPCRVGGAGSAELYWGDPHVHTRLSDGAGSPEFALGYARDVALLEFTAITDHDIEYHHAWFARPVQRTSDAEWGGLGALIRRHREPGRFAVLRGYEWTGRPWGDKCVYFRSDDARIRRYERGDAETPRRLWDLLRAEGVGRVLTVPHTPASSFMGTDWAEHEPDIERVAEVYSMHGASEYHGCPKEMINTVAGRHVQDALGRGYRLGLIAAGDTHSSQPGNPLLRLGPYRTLRHKAGLTAVWAAALTEDAIFDGLVHRRVYATTGARILLSFLVGGVAAGEELVTEDGHRPRIQARVHGTAPLAIITVVRDGRDVHELRPDAEDVELDWEDPIAPSPGRPTYYYLRAVQVDEETAWSSPVWVTCRPA